MDDDLSRFCCQNPDCPDHGQRGHGNLTVCGPYGRHRRRLLYCRTCKARFSEHKGTPLFGCRLPADKAASVLARLQEGVGIRKTGRLVGVSKDTVVRYAVRAGDHAQQLHDELVAFSPRTREVQFDEKWGFVAKKESLDQFEKWVLGAARDSGPPAAPQTGPVGPAAGDIPG